MSPILRLKSMRRQMYDYIIDWRAEYGQGPAAVILSRFDYKALFDEIKMESNIRLTMDLDRHNTFMEVYIDVRDDEEIRELESLT